jgi:hypothetical protein
MAAMRKELDLDESVAPWTSRPGILLRGLPQQANEYNFQNECIDLRFARWCMLHGKPLDTAEIPDYLQTDVRQQVRRNGKNGRCTLLTGSKIYWYLRDRSLVAEEHLYNLGWGEDVVLNGIELPVGGGKRRCRRSADDGRGFAAKAKDLAGNTMSLPCLGSVMYAGLLASDTSVFAKPACDSLHDTTIGPVTVLGVDFDRSQVNIQDDDLE